jgi:hypothetical protein
MRRTLPFLLNVLLSIVVVMSLSAANQGVAHAQTTAYAELTAIDAQEFPTISALVDVFDANGQFVADLEPSDITVYEDGESREVDALDESAVPVQIVVGINPGPPLAVRDGTGAARFTRIVEALGVWANSRPTNSQDDLSLVSLSGSLISHAAAKDWFVSLNSFKPEFRTTTPNLQSLTIALDTVNSPTLQSGMKRAVLFITPHMDDPNIDNTIAPLIQHAIDTKVRVFVWYVANETQFNSPSANAFRMLAQQTNGAFFAFSGKEPFPDPNTYFDSLRHIYSLTYTSMLRSGGDHTIGLDVDTPQGKIPALDKSFTVDVQPPDPIFLSPSLQITRQPPAADPYSEELTPSQQQIEIIVEFPDEHPRDLKRTTLYVDGQAVDQNISAPFERFTWNLNEYASSGTHELVVEVEDVLGLKKSSMGIPVSITVIQPPRGIRALFGRYSSYIILGAIGLAGLLLLGILLRGRTNIVLFRKRKQARQRFEDPLTQPVPVTMESPTSATKKSKTQPRKKVEILQKPTRTSDAPAYLIRLTNGGEPASGVPIPLAEKDMTFGTDPVQSKYVLDDPSISPLHARIKQTDNGYFLIYDHGSIAGTWVNYEPITREGLRLTHGDRIHFGQMAYRFDLSQPPAETAPKVVTKK